MLALQPKSKNRFSIIARLHLILWTAWGVSTAIRLLIFDMTIQVNVEYRIMYSLTLISLTFFGIYNYAERINEFVEREQMMNIKTESHLKNFEQLSTHIYEVNSLKHDIKNHLTALYILINDNRFVEAQNYLDKYTDEVEDITEAVYHRNYLINAIIHDLYKRANGLNIKVILNLSASPNTISEPDLVSLLTNIIDNALEACAKIKDENKRVINLSITRRDPYLAIICENSNPGVLVSDPDQTGEAAIITSKNRKGHGYGLHTVKRITSVYDGIMDINYNEDLFTITVALKDEVR